MTRLSVLLAGLWERSLSKDHRLTVAGGAALSACILALDCMTPLGIADSMLYSFVVLLASLTGRCAIVAMFAVVNTALIIVGWSLSPSGAPASLVAINRSMAIAALWAVAVASIVWLRAAANVAIARRDVEVTQSKLMILHGLATVCFGCKRVRGRDGRWQELSSYCQEQSDGELSCSICDRCAQDHWWNVLSAARRGGHHTSDHSANVEIPRRSGVRM